VFVAQGFAGTRVEDVADHAGVAVPTVYKIFGNKRVLLIGALDLALAADDDEGPLDEQTWFTEQLAEPDPARQLALVARNARRMYERAAALLHVLRAAAPADAELAAAWDDIHTRRAARSRRTATNFLEKAGTRARLRRQDLALTLLTLTEPELFTTYTRTGRSADAYEAWLADMLHRAALSD
jgi:AcrR family transcriptional regulator